MEGNTKINLLISYSCTIGGSNFSLHFYNFPLFIFSYCFFVLAFGFFAFSSASRYVFLCLINVLKTDCVCSYFDAAKDYFGYWKKSCEYVKVFIPFFKLFYVL